jgi:hypothetical protein
MTNLRTQESRYHIRATFVFKLYRSSLPANEDYTWIFIIRKMSMHSVIVRDQQEEQNEEDQINHRDTRILTWKILQSEGKNHGHQSATTFTIFMKCLQERYDLFRRLTRAPPSVPRVAQRSVGLTSLANFTTFKKFGS